MKKLFTLALVLLVTVAGYSQVKKASVKDVKQTPATMQVTKGMESFENVLSEPNMLREDGELDYTTYDWQTNCGIINRTIVWPDGKVNFAYTMATDNSFTDRGTGIGTYDSEADEWIPLGGRIEGVKTGFGSIARYKDNGMVIAAHTATQCGVLVLENRDELAATQGTLAYTSFLDPTYDPSWPVVMTSGPDRDIIHVLVTANAADGAATSVPGAEGVNTPIIYFRSQDGGVTWDKENVIIPFLGTEYGLDWGSNVCYWMETTEDNRLAFVVNNAWSDGMVVYSDDNGETWERKVFYHHPGVTTTFDSWFFYPRWVSAQWGANGELCLAYEFNGSTGEPGSGSYYPAIGGVAFWSENMPYHGETQPAFGPDPTNPMPMVPGNPFIMDTAYLYQDIYASWWLWSDATHPMWDEYIGYVTTLDDEGNWEDPYNATEFNLSSDNLSQHGSYNCGISNMPTLCIVPGTNGSDMVAVWSAMDENNVDEAGNYYFKLFAAYSADFGRTWEHQVHLTNDFMYQYNEYVYTQAAVVGTTLVIASQSDGQCGTYVQSDETDAADNFYQGFTFELNDLFPEAGVSVPEVNHNTHMTLYPNPATDRLNVTLSQNAEIVVYNIMGQSVMTVEGHAGANTLNISDLTSGIYFVNAGSETQKFIVK